MIRVYGPTKGWSSWHVLTHGFVQALSQKGLLAGVMSTNLLDEFAPADGAGADEALFLGDPRGLDIIKRCGNHKRVYLMLAPHCPISKEGIEHIEHYATRILTPSLFCLELLRRSGIKLPASVVPHGIDAAFCDPRANPDAFRFLHLASGDAHTLARKGTIETVEAFLRLPNRGDSRLAVVAPVAALMQLQALVDRDASALEALGVDLVKRLEFDPVRMAAVYRATSCVVQPSRVEGFGMVPLEARACGVPVITTCRTGHRMHVPGESKDGVIVLKGKDKALICGPMDLGEELDVEELRTCLTTVMADWARLRLSAVSKCDEVRSKWSWHEVIKPFIEEREQWI